MTDKQISRFNYIIGRIEGIAAGCDADRASALLDTAEMLDALLDGVEDDG